MWPAVWEVGRYALPLLGLAVVWWVRDRRKDAAAAEVAERTVPAEVDIREAGAAEARLVYIQREMDAERGFHRSQLADRDAEIERQRRELGYRDRLIAELREKVADLQAQLERAAQQLNAVRDRLNELADHEEHTDPRRT